MMKELNDVEIIVHEQTEYIESEDFLNVYGARVHNLKNIDVSIPRNKLVVITGLSGSGKSSLAFDTIHAEGQRRYLETFNAYARQFLGNIERPDVDKITGLSPVIAIEQKTTSKNPRSTVGTITEIYDFLRLLYARIADAYSFNTNEKMVRYSESQIVDLIIQQFGNKKISILSPLVKARKGHYRELFEQLRKQGYLKARIDGEFQEINYGMKLDRYKTHDIELVVDTVNADEKSRDRIIKSSQLALKQGKGVMMIVNNIDGKHKYFSRNLMCPTTGIAYPDPEPNSFSFNSPYGACPKCGGLGRITDLDMKKIVPDNTLSIKQGAIAPLGKYKENSVFKILEIIGDKLGFTLETPFKEMPEHAVDIILYGSEETYYLHDKEKTYYGSYPISFNGIINFIQSYLSKESSASALKWANSFTNEIDCPLCHGQRLKTESLYFKILDKNIADLAKMDLSDLALWMDDLEPKLEERKQRIAHEIIREIQTRIQFLLDVGIDYLTLNRPTMSLSGGESQRIRLATQIGSQLVNVLYILDEPSIGLHQRDNHRLIESLKKLRDIGNSIIVVEHDEEMMMAADYVLDIGPGAGYRGGKVVAQGNPAEFLTTHSLTAKYLRKEKNIPIPKALRQGNGFVLHLEGASGNNLKNVSVDFPLGKLICVTGVSGSGKSTLINETLYPILQQKYTRSEKKPLSYKSVKGLEHLDKVIEIDQSPIGRTPRSNPATYIGVWDDIRAIFALLPESKIRAYKPGRFSFNVKGGRCEECQGAGVKTIEMNFLPDVYVSCPACNGKRYNRETLEVRFKGKNINDILEMTINQAVEFFESVPQILRKIKTMQEVGLGYVKLGQSSTTLSGGEAQRVKLSEELSRKDSGNTIYILDEPTTGLHFEDVNVLMAVINKLVDKGNTVIIIEHNMEVIKQADYIIDMGPEGGHRGGYVVAQGTPQQIIKSSSSYTAKYLAAVLQ